MTRHLVDDLHTAQLRREILERAARIELASSAWKAEVLPLHNARALFMLKVMVEEAGFEPTYSMRSDLQSDAFNHSATPPKFFGSPFEKNLPSTKNTL